MTPIRASFVCSKACAIVGEDAFCVASQHSIGLTDIKWVTFMRPRSRYVSWYVEKCQLVAVRIPSLFKQNLLKAVGRTQIEGRCKVYAGKTNWNTNWKLYPRILARKKWGALEGPWQITWRDCMIRTWRAIFVDFRTEIGKSKNSHFNFWTLQEDNTPHKVT